MTLNERIEVLCSLGEYLGRRDDRLQAHLHRASVHNPWFTPDFLDYAIGQIAMQLSNREGLRAWTADLDRDPVPKRVGIIMAGNIPLVGFHDMLCVFIAGHRPVIRLSDRDKFLIPFIIKVLGEIDARTTACFQVVEKLTDFDAVIATGSNNSARYFEYYFEKYPHIIRRNKNAVAILRDNESEEAIDALCDDIFLYFGMGCRNVSHVFVPEGYDFRLFIEKAKRYRHLAGHHKYKNNLDYNLALVILNHTPHIALPHLVMIENAQLISPVSTLHYSYYTDIGMLTETLKQGADDIQCVVTDTPVDGLRCIPFGTAQQPALDDYADGIDTLAFLQTLGR